MLVHVVTFLGRFRSSLKHTDLTQQTSAVFRSHQGQPANWPTAQIPVKHFAWMCTRVPGLHCLQHTQLAKTRRHSRKQGFMFVCCTMNRQLNQSYTLIIHIRKMSVQRHWTQGNKEILHLVERNHQLCWDQCSHKIFFSHICICYILHDFVVCVFFFNLGGTNYTVRDL